MGSIGRYAAAAVLLAGLGAGLGIPTARAVGSGCLPGLCSRTVNDSGGPVLVAHDWCGDAERLQQDAPPCGAAPSDRRLVSGERTPLADDWDAFRVDAGRCYRFDITGPLRGRSAETVDRRGESTGAWIRIHNDETAVIRARAC
ncbi:hypothetical protein G5C51_31000 [Streptomyces sp. A7024]|uniref:Uncharacterized protein n=1 Tax=Streptomyces coryli TaxID=1128680 RepID=A0A6G4U801_9ACTN|nr:hypothetical protein [Streptomyces coryli]NGN68314.1 hypothetical protein [Streptomyces coryli]